MEASMNDVMTAAKLVSPTATTPGMKGRAI